jgi:hypothetical protein
MVNARKAGASRETIDFQAFRGFLRAGGALTIMKV